MAVLLALLVTHPHLACAFVIALTRYGPLVTAYRSPIPDTSTCLASLPHTRTSLRRGGARSAPGFIVLCAVIGGPAGNSPLYSLCTAHRLMLDASPYCLSYGAPSCCCVCLPTACARGGVQPNPEVSPLLSWLLSGITVGSNTRD